MRLFFKIVAGVVLAILGRLVIPQTWVAKYPTAYWSALILVILILFFIDKWPSREERRKKRSARLLSHRGRVFTPSHQRNAYWGTAPAQVELIGREREEEVLWNLLASGTRGIGVFGPPGVGKSSLVGNIARHVSENFENVLWHSLRSAPPLREVLDRWLAAVRITPLSERLGERLDLLIAFLARSRTLVVLDNAETVFDDARVPSVRQGDPEYRELLDRIITNPGNSTLIVTSTVLFDPFHTRIMESGLGLVELSGLNRDAIRSLLLRGGARATRTEAQQVERAYSGNPQAVLVLAEFVRDAYGGDLSRLLKVERDLVNFERFDHLLERQISALSAEERLLLFLLVVWREPVSLEILYRELRDHLGLRAPVSVGEIVAKLRARHLVIDTAQGVTASGFMLELVTHYLVRTIAHEIVSGNPQLIATCPLVQATWPESVREQQRTFLLRPLVERIAKEEALQIENVRSLLRGRLRSLCNSESSVKSYTAANILYLMEAVGDEFTDLDLQGVTIRGGDFRFSWLHRTNMTNADLSGSAFAQTFGTLHSIAISSDAEGKYLAAGTSLGRVLIWLRDTGELIAERQNHSETVRSLCFSFDSEILYSGGEDGRLVAWQFKVDKAEFIDEAHSNWIWAIRLLSSTERLVTAGGDGQVKVWSCKPLREELVLQFANDWIWDVTYSSEHLVCCSEDGSIWSWQVDLSAAPILTVGECRLEARLEFPVKCIVVSPQEPQVYFLGCSNGFIYRLDLNSKECIPFGPRHRGVVRSIVLLPARGLVASAGDDKVIRIWKSKDGTAVRLLEGHTSRVWSLASNSSLPIISSAGDDRSARIWRTDGPTHPERSLYGVEHSVRSLDLDYADSVIAACSDDVVRRWHESCDVTENVIVRRNSRLTVARAYGETYITSGDDGSISVKAGDTPLRTWSAHVGAIECLRVQSDFGLIASGGEDRVIRIWSTDGDCITELKYHRNRIWDLAFSPEGRHLASGGGDHIVGLWRVDDGRLLASLPGHQSLVLAVSWLTEKIFVTGGSDGTVRFWAIRADADTGAEILRIIDVGFMVREIACSSKGAGLIIVGGRTRQPESGSKLVCLDGEGNILQEVTRTLSGAIRALHLDSDSHRLFVAGDGKEIVEFEAEGSLIEKKRLRINGPYDGAILFGVSGLSEGQKTALRELGAHI